jgi:hypothetical protein
MPGRTRGGNVWHVVCTTRIRPADDAPPGRPSAGRGFNALAFAGRGSLPGWLGKTSLATWPRIRYVRTVLVHLPHNDAERSRGTGA